jgi:hypothetical protein
MDDDEGLDEQVADEVEFAKAVLELMKRERTELIKAGLDVDHMIEELENIMQEAQDAKAHLDDLKKRMVMEMSKSLIGEKGAPAASTDQFDMASKELRKGETAEEYFQRVKRRAGKPDEGCNNA